MIQAHLETRNNLPQKLFAVNDRKWKRIWKVASNSTAIEITSKLLRARFSTQLGEIGFPDRLIDIFQDRVPCTVLAEHLTRKGLQRFKRICDKADLKIID